MIMGQCGKKDNKSNYNEMNSHHQKKTSTRKLSSLMRIIPYSTEMLRHFYSYNAEVYFKINHLVR